MNDYSDIIKEYFETVTYNSSSPISCRVEYKGVGDYKVYFVCSGVDIVYDVFDFREEIDADGTYYSAVIKLDYCNIDGFSVSGDTDYYLDVLRRYQKLCSYAEDLLDSIDTYWDDRRTEFTL